MTTATQAPSRRRKTGRSRAADTGPLRTIGVGFTWLFVAFNIAMLAWVALQGFRDTREIFGNPWGWPENWTFDNFATAWNAGNFGTAAFNSVVLTLSASVAIVALAAPAAYYLSRQDNRLTRSVTLLFILGLGVPVQVIIVPLFVMLARVGLTNSIFGLALVYMGVSMPFTVFLLTAFFRSLPGELEEAAALDGSTPVRTFWTIMLPLARGGLLTAFVLQLISNWNETVLALVLLQTTDRYTLPIALINFVQRQTYSGADWGGLFAGLVLVIIPVLLIYLWLGRRLTEGLTLGMGK
ncbi:carbohydrate ABC transporter permease [Pseudactinotalea sp. Z1739]|uniref:carbohydrate ABC transporter permease n=1 Tax=Pseudactinotalea sp. Z1739 TaxID=3413028 RepID=UPI003C7B805A